MHPKQIEAVLALPGPERFEHFVKVVCDREEVWGLYDGGWALAATDDGTPVFPLWPAREYAALCATGDWQSYSPRAVPLDEAVSDMLPRLKADGVLPGVFFLPNGSGTTPSVDVLLAALETESKNY